MASSVEAKPAAAAASKPVAPSGSGADAKSSAKAKKTDARGKSFDEGDAMFAADAAQPKTAPNVTSPEVVKLLKTRYANGITIAMSIPSGFADDVEARPKSADHGDGYAWSQAYSFWAVRPSTDLAPLVALLPDAKRAEAASANRVRQAAMIWNDRTAKHAAKERMRRDETDRDPFIGHQIKENNDEFVRSADGFAKANQAIALRGTGLASGHFMTYAKPEDLSDRVNATSAKVKDVLQGDPAADKIAKVHALGIFCHGTESSLEGDSQSRAKHAKITTSALPTVVGAMNASLADDVRVMLFACSAANGDAKRETDPAKRAKGEGGIADAFRDELVKDTRHAGAMVGGHIGPPGHCVRNTPRFFTGTELGDDTGKEARYERAWRGTELARIFARLVPPRAPTRHEARRFDELIQLFNRRELFIYTTDTSTPASCMAAFSRYADENLDHVVEWLGGSARE